MKSKNIAFEQGSCIKTACVMIWCRMCDMCHLSAATKDADAVPSITNCTHFGSELWPAVSRPRLLDAMILAACKVKSEPTMMQQYCQALKSKKQAHVVDNEV